MSTKEIMDHFRELDLPGQLTIEVGSEELLAAGLSWDELAAAKAASDANWGKTTAEEKAEKAAAAKVEKAMAVAIATVLLGCADSFFFRMAQFISG
eukprot:COSAG05_NODE_1870_length_3926_cov_10.367912_5_plen_96_part_00